MSGLLRLLDVVRLPPFLILFKASASLFRKSFRPACLLSHYVIVLLRSSVPALPPFPFCECKVNAVLFLPQAFPCLFLIKNFKETDIALYYKQLHTSFFFDAEMNFFWNLFFGDGGIEAGSCDLCDLCGLCDLCEERDKWEEEALDFRL